MRCSTQLGLFLINWICLLDIGWCVDMVSKEYTFASPAQSPTSPTTLSRELQSTVSQSGQTLAVSYVDSSITSSTNASVALFESNCNVVLPNDEIVSTTSVDVTPPTISYDIAIDGDGLHNSSIVTFDSASNGTIEFCVAVDLIDNGNATSTKYTRFNVPFDLLETGIFLSATTGQVDENQEVDVDIDFAVSACDCDADFNCFSTSQTYVYDLAAPVFRICLTPSSGDLRVSNMDLMMSNSALDYTYEPVSFGTDDEDVDELTTISEQGNIKMIKTRIVYGLYEDGNTGVIVSGSVFVSALSGKTEDFATYSHEIKVRDDSQRKGCFFNLFRVITGVFR